ncbi:MAG TPA: hypothetical protein VJG83_00495 [archaeon]|nr:hypothetical protein [archaeon]
MIATEGLLALLILISFTGAILTMQQEALMLSENISEHFSNSSKSLNCATKINNYYAHSIEPKFSPGKIECSVIPTQMLGKKSPLITRIIAVREIGILVIEFKEHYG